MPQRDVVSWNAMIAACAQNGHDKEALDLFDQMQLSGLKPTSVTFICVLDACANLGHLEAGQKIHAAVAVCKYEEDIVVGNALISMYGKCRSPHDAKSVFLKLPEPDVVSWSALIAAYVHNGLRKDALELFHHMQLEEIEPNNITFVSVLDACANLVALGDGRKIHIAIVESTYEQDVSVGNGLVNMYGKCGNLHDARSVFDRMHCWTVVTWSALITACAQNGHCKDSLDNFHQMQLEGINPDNVTFVCVLDACASLAALKEGQGIHAALVQNGIEQDIILGNALINMYCKCRILPDARCVFVKLSHRNVITWTAMITACAQNGHEGEAVDLFCQMQLVGVNANNITFICVIEACTTMAVRGEGQKLHSAIVDSGCEQDVSVGTALVNMYGKCGSLNDARRAFGSISHQNIISWNSMIAACAQNEHAKEALDHFHHMQLNGFKPDNITFVCVLDACSSLAALDVGKGLHAAIAASGGLKDLVVVNALINMYGKCGNMHEAVQLFSRMSQHDLVSWNAIIAACAQNGYAQEALEFFHQMQLQGMKPDEITFVCILTACSHAGRVDDGRHHFASLITDCGLTCTVDHYVCMVDLLGRAGHLDDAEKLIETMSFEQGTSAWASLLGACKIHGDLERGARAADHLFGLDPQNAVPYVVLSNIYSSALGVQEDEASVGGKAH